MRLIDADETKDFFFGETSGTDEVIQELINKHNLTYVNDVNEDEVMSLCHELLEMVQNVIDTQPTAFDVDKVVEQLEEKKVYENYTVYLMKNLAFDEAIEIVKAGGKE